MHASVVYVLSLLLTDVINCVIHMCKYCDIRVVQTVAVMLFEVIRKLFGDSVVIEMFKIA